MVHPTSFPKSNIMKYSQVVILASLLIATMIGGSEAFLQSQQQQSTNLVNERSSTILNAATMVEETTGTFKDEEVAGVEFPPPLTGLQRIQRALEFYKRALPVLGAYKVKELELQYLTPNLTDEEEEQIWNDLDEWGSTRIASTIQEMKGFYVKTGQVISTRVDLFPEAYTNKLQALQDGIEPMPFELVKQVVEQELLNGSPLSELFATFEEEPLGSASIAQVHKATLLDGRVVAVKLQRPNVEPKLRGDIANLKRLSKALRKSLPVDYYAVFCELGDALENELDFLAEAQAMKKIHMAIQHDATSEESDSGLPRSPPPVNVPLPIGELVTKRVLVMDFCPGTPLNRLSEAMEAKGIVAGSPEAKIAGRRILDSLSLAFGRMIFGAGFVHGDPHPGNIFVGEGGKVSLIDCGQFKALSKSRQVQFAKLVLAVDGYQKAVKGEDKKGLQEAKTALATVARGFGIECVDDRHVTDDDLVCAIALVLFSDTGVELPGGFSSNELSEESPIRLLTSFPQELILLGRATVLLKGIAKKLNVPLSLVDRWGPNCEATLASASTPTLPLWATDYYAAASSSSSRDPNAVAPSSSQEVPKIRFRQVGSLFKAWVKGKGSRLATRTIQKLPATQRTKVLEYVVARQEAKEALKQ